MLVVNAFNSIGSGRACRGYTLVQLLTVLILIAVLAGMAIASYRMYVERARVSQAIGELGQLEIAIEQFSTNNDGDLPIALAVLAVADTTDPWGTTYQYVNISLGGAPRTDQAGVAVNTDYDLFSMGQDMSTGLSLTATASEDDIIRGNNGGYLGPVADYSRLP